MNIKIKNAPEDHMLLDEVPPKGLVEEIFDVLGGETNPNHGVSYSLTDGNFVDEILQTPNLWGHNPAVNDYEPAARNLTDAIERLISTTQHTIDISTLQPLANERFLEAIRKGISSAYDQGQRFAVRVLQGIKLGLPTIPSHEQEHFIHALEIPKDIPIYVGSIRTSDLSWNHSKMIIVDGQRAIVGGHNLWTEIYCEFAPVHDISILLSGPAVATAQAFLNAQWNLIARKNDNPNYILFSTMGLGGNFYPNSLPKIQAAPSTAVGSTKVLSLARMGNNLVEPSASANASRTARIEAVKRAKQHIRLSQQKIGAPYDHLFLDAICQHVADRKQLSIIISDKGARNGKGSGYSGDSMEETAKKIGNEVSKKTGLTGSQLATFLAEHVHIGPTRIYDRQPGDPRAESWKWRNGSEVYEPANHAKVYIIDEEAYYVGSDNVYAIGEVIELNVNGLQEFGFLISGQVETRRMRDEYWDKFWSYSSQFEYKDWHNAFS